MKIIEDKAEFLKLYGGEGIEFLGYFDGVFSFTGLIFRGPRDLRLYASVKASRIRSVSRDPVDLKDVDFFMARVEDAFTGIVEVQFEEN